MNDKTLKPAAVIPFEPEGPGFVMSRGYTLEEGLASVGPGWGELVGEIFAALPPKTVIAQVKEKFGSLRVYHEPYRPAFQKLIDEVERRSGTVCEECGAPGEVDRSAYWIKVLCPLHIAERAASYPRRMAETVAFVEEMIDQAKLAKRPPEEQN